MLKNKSIGTEQFKIASYQMDIKGNATLTSLSGFFQEIAGNHANANGFGYKQMIDNGHIWVLTRLKMEIHKFPVWAEEINVSTWVVNREKFFSRRDFQIHSQNNELLVSASSGWMLLDLKTKRPKLVDSIEMDIPMHPEKLAINGEFSKIETVSLIDAKNDYLVRYSDLDIANHLNNVIYTRILLDSYSYDWRKSKVPKSFEINYLVEAVYADELEIINSKPIGENSIIIQEMKRKSDDKIICKARVEWD
ncbi:MAG: acyl-ACP thioesterase domain-containing protein [Bacteroidota bacterium]